MELSILKNMLIGGAKKIADNKQELNDMNVSSEINNWIICRMNEIKIIEQGSISKEELR